MTAIEELEKLIDEPDRQKRREMLEAWGARWVGELSAEQEITQKDLAGLAPVEADAKLQTVAVALKKSIIHGILGQKDILFYLVQPMPEEPGAFRYKLSLTFLLKVPNEPKKSRLVLLV